jgi:hypothetical protein
VGEQITVSAVGDTDKYNKLCELVKKTHKESPKSEDLAALQQLLNERPDFWRGVGDMANRTLDHLCRTYYQQSAYMRECVMRRVKEMREQSGYSQSSFLERILIEQILVCYVNLYVLEINSAGKLCESHSTDTGLYWDRRLDGAQRRFTRACETLARVRKLMRYAPALQVNIAAEGGQQVNVTT